SRRLLIRVKGGYPHHASAVSNRGLQSYTCARARIPSLSVLLALTVAALLGGATGLAMPRHPRNIGFRPGLRGQSHAPINLRKHSPRLRKRILVGRPSKCRLAARPSEPRAAVCGRRGDNSSSSSGSLDSRSDQRRGYRVDIETDSVTQVNDESEK